MKEAIPKQKLTLMHETLDRQLEQISLGRNSLSAKENRGNNSFPKPELSKLNHISNDLTNFDSKSRKNEILDLQKKLKNLQKKMENLTVSSEESFELQRQLKFQKQTNSNKSPLKEQIPRIISREQKSNSKKKVENYSSDEDSNDYFEMQNQIEKIKKDRRISYKNVQENLKQIKIQRPESSQRVNRQASMGQSLLQAKYSHHNRKSMKKQNKSIAKSNRKEKNLSQSVASKTSEIQSLNELKILQRASSKKSTKSIYSGLKKSSKKEKIISNGEALIENTPNRESEELMKQKRKRIALEKQVLHFKKQVKQFEEKLKEMRIVEIQYKKMKVNFAKSEQIRVQQKKIIQSLKSRLK